jgi:hypothetical protein
VSSDVLTPYSRPSTLSSNMDSHLQSERSVHYVLSSASPGTGWQREGDVRTSGHPLQETRDFRVQETREFRVSETSEFHGQGTREFREQETRGFRGQVHAGVSPGLASISNFSPCPPPLLALRISLFRL